MKYLITLLAQMITKKIIMTFHLYGLDTIITDNLNIKIIEINGSPTLRDFDEEFFNYKRMLDEIIKLTTDILYKPTSELVYQYVSKYGKFKNSDTEYKLCDMKFIECVTYMKTLKKPVYFVKTICDSYPFIIDGFFNDSRSKVYQRIKNSNCSKLQLFYGKRDLYIRNKSSKNYYDELLELNNSQNGKTAKIINKIQGITFYLASKDKPYDQMSNFNFVPKSVLF